MNPLSQALYVEQGVEQGGGMGSVRINSPLCRTYSHFTRTEYNRSALKFYKYALLDFWLFLIAVSFIYSLLFLRLTVLIVFRFMLFVRCLAWFALTIIINIFFICTIIRIAWKLRILMFEMLSRNNVIFWRDIEGAASSD